MREGQTKRRRFVALPKLGLGLLVLAVVAPAFADNVLIQNLPWGTNAPDEADMTAVFGVGGYTEYNFGVPAGTAFSAANNFVMVEGGDGTDGQFQSFLTANQTSILNWVNAGGDLLLQAAGWSAPDFTLGPGTIGAGASDVSSCGTLTAAGVAAFTFAATPTNQCGSYLSHDDISGAGLTAFMTADTTGNPNVAGIAVGSGYIMYSGLTDSQFHIDGSLNQDVIAFTAAQNVPEPSALILIGTGLIGLPFFRRRAPRN